jgi:3-dehydroquinate synthase
MKTVRVSSTSGEYGIRIESGLFDSLGPLLRDLFPGSPNGRIGLVSNPVVWGIYGSRVLASVSGAGFSHVVSLHSDGEPFKNISSVMALLSTFLENRWERREPLCAIGGGVTGDMGGLVAALLLRGVPLVHVPTTVVAQVDSSIGGKTGIDHPMGKNLIGAFYPPKSVLTDPMVLESLPLRERRAGLGEVLKYAFIGDHDLLELLGRKIESLAGDGFDAELWEETIALCSFDKARIVSADEREGGERMLLNFGHTFVHALEGALGFSGILHGEAVALGMLSAARIAHLAGLAGPDTFEFMKELIARAALPVSWPEKVTYEAIAPYLVRDKKVQGKQVTMVLPTEPGKVSLVRDYDPALLPTGVFA